MPVAGSLQAALRTLPSSLAVVRGDIQAGLTGDKVAGFDPAAAPLETDQEAGGVCLDPEWVERTREQERAGRPNSARANAATPELQPDGCLHGRQRLGAAFAAGAAAGVAAGAVLAALLAGAI